MRRVFRFILRDVRRALIVALLAVIATAVLVGSFNKCLKTEEAPNAIVSLELAHTYAEANRVVQSWQPYIDKAQLSIYTDLAFIFAYTFGLYVLIVLAKRSIRNTKVPIWKTPAWVTNIVLILPLVAFMCDIVENISMLIFIWNEKISVYFFFVPAVVKFVSIVMVLVYCIASPMAHRHILKSSRLYAPALITVIISYFVFIRLDQGQDIMIRVSESPYPLIFTVVCAFLWTWYIWYSSRLVGYAKMQQPNELIPPSYHKHFPRLLAFNGLVSLQAASLALPTVGGLSTAELWLFVLLQNGVYFLWDDYLDGSGRRDSLILVILISVGYGVLLAVLGVYKVFGNQVILVAVDGVIYIVALLVIKMWISRRRDLKEDTWTWDPCKSPVKIEGYLLILGIKVLGLSKHAFQKEKAWFPAFNVLAIGGLIIYWLGFAWFDFAGWMGPLAFVLLAFGILVGLSNIITLFSIYKKTNFFFVLFVIAVIVGSFHDPFKVRLKDDKQPTARMEMLDYFDKWVEQRRKEIDSSSNFPVYVVIADGGASRSGYWVSSVLSELQDTSRYLMNVSKADSRTTIFSDHLLCLAGASGGSVGTATFYALLRKELIDTVPNTSSYQERSRNFLKNDFLTPVVTHWLGTDIFQHLVPFKIAEDRAGILETAMEEFSVDDNLGFKEPFDEMVDRSGRMPMLFINVTSVHDGLPAVVSSVPVKSFSQRVDVMKELEVLKEGTIRYSTAVVLGARFPYVSPAGRIGDDYYVDGGYFDNTGAGIVHEMLQKVDSTMKRRVIVIHSRMDSIKKGYTSDPRIWSGTMSRIDTSFIKTYERLRFRLIYLNNSPFPPPAPKPCSDDKLPSGDIYPLANDLAAPILTVLGTYGSQTDVNNRRLQSFMSRLTPGEKMHTVNLYTERDTNVYPMNWVISQYNLDRMNARLEETKKKEMVGILEF